MKMVALAMLLLVVASVGAQDFPASYCPNLFSGTSSGTSSPNLLIQGSTYTGLLSISLLIVLLVLTALGIVYAFGLAFRVESLKAFTRSEVLESFLNIILIIVIGTGVAFSGSVIAFVTNVGLAGIQSVTGNTQAALAAVQPTDTQSVYTGICNNYVTKGISDIKANIEQGQIPLAVMNFVMSIGDTFEEEGNGITISPLMGAFPIVSLLSTQVAAFDAIIGLLLVIVFFLFIIYSIFPVFLYVGILLRSFPWTRAAGGTFIAMFIAFYIIFPAILYPFSLYMQSVAVTLNVPTGVYNSFGLETVLGAIPYFGGTAMLTEISGFAQTVAATGLQLMGILIGLVVSLDLVEAIGKLLGAPSAHTRSLLGKLL
jgi:hypothetical protein